MVGGGGLRWGCAQYSTGIVDKGQTEEAAVYSTSTWRMWEWRSEGRGMPVGCGT